MLCIGWNRVVCPLGSEIIVTPWSVVSFRTLKLQDFLGRMKNFHRSLVINPPVYGNG